MDEVDNVLYCLLNMLYYNEQKQSVEQEQVSIVLGKDFVITFQEDPHRDVFDPIRERLKLHNSKLRQRSADYLSYTMLDLIVDNYFRVMESWAIVLNRSKKKSFVIPIPALWPRSISSAKS
jgi:magnesium transporter